MKTFDLDAYGVMEMNEAEMQNVEVGNIFQVIGSVLTDAVVAFADVLQDAYDWLFDKGIDIVLGRTSK